MSGAATVKRDAVNPEPVELIAADIQAIAVAMAKISATRLTRSAIVALVHDSSGLPKRTINSVLDHLAYLEKQWLKPLPQTSKA